MSTKTNNSASEDYIVHSIGWVGDLTLDEIRKLNEEGGVFEDVENFNIKADVKHLINTNADKKVWALDYKNEDKIDIKLRETIEKHRFN